MSNRLVSIDIFRGLTIFFMIVVNSPGSWEFVFPPLRHAKWDGLTPTDLVFPFFVFIVGLSMSYSFKKYDRADLGSWLAKIAKRTLLIFLLGLLLNWFPFYNKGLEDLRIFGVLQRIALSYGMGSLVIVFVRGRWIPIVFALILLLYYFLLLQFGGEDPLSLEENAVRSLDLRLFGESHLYGGYGIPFDPEGLLSTLPAVGTVLLGYIVGRRTQSVSDHLEKSRILIPIGALSILVGVGWHHFGFPVNKPIWSSSYVLVTGGMATLLFSILLFFIDYLGKRKWFGLFRPFGMNALISYVLSGVFLKICFLIKIGDSNLYGWLYQNLFSGMGPELGSLMQALCYTMFIFIFAWWLYKKEYLIKI